MANINKQKLVYLLILPIMLSACVDKDDASMSENSTAQQEQMDDTSSNQEENIATDKEVDLQELMHQVAQEGRLADQQGFVWSTTDALIAKGYAKAKKGNDSEAKSLFQEAKSQFALSIKQAKYASKNWHLLVPKND